MLHSKKPKIKAVFVDTLEYQGTLDTMVHLEETAETDSGVTKVIKVSLEENEHLFLHVLSFNFTIYNNNHL